MLKRWKKRKGSKENYMEGKKEYRKLCGRRKLEERN